MKVAVAGAGGFIAGHLIRQLAKEGHEITAVDIKPLDDWFQVRKLKNVKNWFYLKLVRVNGNKLN